MCALLMVKFGLQVLADVYFTIIVASILYFFCFVIKSFAGLVVFGLISMFLL